MYEVYSLSFINKKPHCTIYSKRKEIYEIIIIIIIIIIIPPRPGNTGLMSSGG